MQTKVICLNGPPRSGKDTGCYILHDLSKTSANMKFAEPLHKAAQACLSGSDKNFYSEHHKDEVIPYIGVSYRQLCINLSEQHFKPTYGNDVFGRIALHKLKTDEEVCKRLKVQPTYVFSDSGFREEVLPILDYVGAENVTLIHLYREDKSFANDSRGYIDLSDFGIIPKIVYNTTIEEFETSLKTVYDGVFNP